MHEAIETQWHTGLESHDAEGCTVKLQGLFIRMVSNQPLLPSQRVFSLWLGVSLLLMGAAVSIFSALQFHTVLRSLGEKEIPRGYWTSLGVWLNFSLALVALALAIHFVISG